MPLFWVEMKKGRTTQQKRDFVEAVTEATTRTLGVPADSVRIRMIEIDGHDVARAGVYDPPEADA